MPNATPRYRAGIHEGVDFFTSYACVDVSKGTQVARCRGRRRRPRRPRLSRPGPERISMTWSATVGGAGIHGRRRSRPVPRPPALDRPRRRHRHALLSPGRHSALRSQAGTHVVAGSKSSAISGDSGTPESASNPDFEIHLHFEIRTASRTWARGSTRSHTRNLYERVFGLAADHPIAGALIPLAAGQRIL